MQRRFRLLLVLFLVGGHVVLGSLYAQQPVNPQAGVYPGSAEITTVPERYIGDHIVVSGFVQQTSPLVVQIQTHSQQYTITVTGERTFSATRGDIVRAFGVLETPHRARIIRGFVVSSENRLYARTISFIAGLWVLIRLVRQWRVDYSTLAFTPRQPSAGTPDTEVSDDA